MLTYTDGTLLLSHDDIHGIDVPMIGKAEFNAYAEYDGGGAFRRLSTIYSCEGIDLDDYAGVEINGVKYLRSQT